VPTIQSRIRQNKYKITPQRQAVLKVLSAATQPLSPSEVHELVQAAKPSTGMATVYRSLQLLSELGLVCELHTAGNCHRYLLRRIDSHHHHLICSGCGQVIHVEGCGLKEITENLSRQTGFAIDAHLLEFIGRCRNCQKEAGKV
jgi:Fe2+/Zn2+ uptake regulation proteins